MTWWTDHDMTKDEIRKHLDSGAFAGDHKFEILVMLLLEIADALAEMNADAKKPKPMR